MQCCSRWCPVESLACLLVSITRCTLLLLFPNLSLPTIDPVLSGPSLQSPLHIAGALLVMCKWDLNRIVEEYTVDPAALLTRAGFPAGVDASTFFGGFADSVVHTGMHVNFAAPHHSYPATRLPLVHNRLHPGRCPFVRGAAHGAWGGDPVLQRVLRGQACREHVRPVVQYVPRPGCLLDFPRGWAPCCPQRVSLCKAACVSPHAPEHDSRMGVSL